ncbi:MAG: MBL fold metallo-hydrolase, partial [Angelakisella sp.]
LKNGRVDSVNLLSAPHHGSNTSIDYDFMKALNPQVSVISCGKDNDYGHPHAEVLKLYDKMGIEHLRTDRQGNIVAITDGENIKITAEREE